MPIDSSIYLNMNVPDIMGNIEKGLSLKDMASQRAVQQDALKKQKAFDAAYQSGVVKNPDGTVGYDGSKSLSEMFKVDPKKAIEFQQQNVLNQAATDKAKYETQKNQLETISGLLAGVTDQPSYTAALQKGKAMSLTGIDQLPANYDPNVIQHLNLQTLTQKERNEQFAKERGLNIEQQNADTKAQAQKDAHADRIEKLKATKQAKVSGDTQKMSDSLKKDLDADAGRTGNFGMVSKKVLQAQNLETLAKAFPDGNLDSRQVEELSLGLANMLSGSSGAARSQVEALVPHTWTGKLANVQEWLTSDPKGAGQQEFVKRMMHTIEREKETSLKQLNDIREQRLTSHSKLAKADPDTYNAILQSYGLDPSNYDERGLRKNQQRPAETTQQAVSAQSHPEANQAMDWAKQNPNDPRAQAIMQRLGQ